MMGAIEYRGRLGQRTGSAVAHVDEDPNAVRDPTKQPWGFERRPYHSKGTHWPSQLSLMGQGTPGIGSLGRADRSYWRRGNGS